MASIVVRRCSPLRRLAPATAASAALWAPATAASAALWALSVGVLAYYVASSWSVSIGYDMRSVYLAGRALTEHRPVYDVANFGYPPSAALLVGAPLSRLGFGAAAHAAIVVLAVLVVATVVLSARIVKRPVAGPATAVGVMLIVLTHIVPEALGLENLSILVGFLGAAAWLAWSREREMACGLLLGLTLAIKPLLAPLCLGLLVLRRWRVLAVAAAVLVTLNFAAIAVDPSAMNGGSAALRAVLTARGPFGGYFALFNSALASVCHLLGWPSWLTLGTRALVAAVAVAGIAAIWRRRPEPARSLEAGGLLLAGAFLSSSVLENHWLLVLVPFAYASVLPGSPLRWWPVSLGAVFAGELVVLPQQIGHLGYFGTLTVGLCFGLCLVVVSTAGASFRPILAHGLSARRPARRLARRSARRGATPA